MSTLMVGRTGWVLEDIYGNLDCVDVCFIAKMNIYSGIFQGKEIIAVNDILER